MDLVSILFIAVGLSMDTFAVSVANGMAIKKNKFVNMLKFSICFGVTQGVMTIAGYFMAHYFLKNMMAYSNWIAFIILSIVGGRMIYESVCNKQAADVKCVDVSSEKMLVLAMATSIDAMAVGVSLALMESGIMWPSIIIGLVTCAISGIGLYIGNRIGAVMQKGSEIFGGSVLILIGVKILAEPYLLSV